MSSSLLSPNCPQACTNPRGLVAATDIICAAGNVRAAGLDRVLDHQGSNIELTERQLRTEAREQPK